MTNQERRSIIETTISLNMRLEKIYERNGSVWIVVHSDRHPELHDFNDWFIKVTSEEMGRECEVWTCHGNRKNEEICITFRV